MGDERETSVAVCKSTLQHAVTLYPHAAIRCKTPHTHCNTELGDESLDELQERQQRDCHAKGGHRFNINESCQI